MSRFFLLYSGPGKPAENMALDEALLVSMPRLQVPVLRFYSWTEPAATFGYFQKYAEVEAATPLRPLIRRPTGGGIVPHDADWTYSAVFPTNHEWYQIAAIESYRGIHAWIQAAFARLTVSTILAPSSLKAAPGQCFAGYEQFDLLWRGRKIAGAAQRRSREGLLIQGSVQPPPIGLDRAAWAKAMCDSAREDKGVEWKPLEADAELAAKVDELAATKYARAGFNRKR